MRTRTLFLLAAAAWLVAGLARPILALNGLLDLGTPDRTQTAVLSGVFVGLVVGGLHLISHTRGTALFGLVVGSPAIFTLVAVPQRGDPAAIAVLVVTTLCAYGLSAWCLWRTARPADASRSER